MLKQSYKRASQAASHKTSGQAPGVLHLKASHCCRRTTHGQDASGRGSVRPDAPSFQTVSDIKQALGITRVSEVL